MLKKLVILSALVITGNMVCMHEGDMKTWVRGKLKNHPCPEGTPEHQVGSVILSYLESYNAEVVLPQQRAQDVKMNAMQAELYQMKDTLAQLTKLHQKQSEK